MVLENGSDSISGGDYVRVRLGSIGVNCQRLTSSVTSSFLPLSPTTTRTDSAQVLRLSLQACCLLLAMLCQ